MRDAVQKVLNELTAQNDSRISVFEIQIEGLDDATLSLSGKLLHRNQLATLKEWFSYHFPDLNLNITSIRVLDTETHGLVHVATNLTGLYEKPTFGMPLSSELYYGTELEVLDEDNRWVFTRQSDEYLGWVYRPYLNEGFAPPDSTYLVLAPSVELRAEPNEQSETVTRVVSGTGVTVVETFDNWSRVSANKTGWIRSSYLRALFELPKVIEDQRTTLIEDSMRMIGVPYLWGGTSGNGIDCSGFVCLLHRWIGVDIPRDADMQHAAAKRVEPPFEVGDLLFFAEHGSDRRITHVGVSLGGWKMIHASRRNNGVYIDDVQEHEFLKQIFVSAGSLFR
jgi:gamma-D-glutamyl-L-lysine dipeptidyl-peptidase